MAEKIRIVIVSKIILQPYMPLRQNMYGNYFIQMEHNILCDMVMYKIMTLSL